MQFTKHACGYLKNNLRKVHNVHRQQLTRVLDSLESIFWILVVIACYIENGSQHKCFFDFFSPYEFQGLRTISYVQSGGLESPPGTAEPIPPPYPRPERRALVSGVRNDISLFSGEGPVFNNIAMY
jgi:hypothetical protein